MLQRLLNGTDIDTLCNQIDVADLAKNLRNLYGMGDRDEWKKKIPELLLVIKVLKPLTWLPGFPAKIRELLEALDSLDGISTENPNLHKLMEKPEVVEAAMRMASPDLERLFKGQ